MVIIRGNTLIELNDAMTMDEAEAKVKSTRNVIDIKPAQRESLEKLIATNIAI
ncbi:hypothetical protein [Paenibacillus sp. GP183]|uniref:hypothetical protein n=1 Tax=Paenibacillus sp. GP183 TaxID=1882751 RepID=UPI001495D614|nr:hypothetical protein [Paenibacillus sp. GP183]